MLRASLPSTNSDMASHQPPFTPAEPHDDAATSDTSSSDGTDEQVELLVKGREKRSTAGTRMSSLLVKEGEDELELLFAEDEQEEDEEFEDEDAEDGSDAQLDSASSDDDQGPAKDDDDLAGERELQRQTRVERQKKRKAQDAFLKPGVLNKRIRLEPRRGAPGAMSAPTTPVPRPKKKAERTSWLPGSEEGGAVRASSRKQTVKNKEIVHSRLLESEKRRMKQVQVMEEAAKRKEASKPKAMTQAQRMEEADRTERQNAKSLNRWETAEKKRLEEQKAKLEALHNRQLTGPVISWWSGMARWVNGKLKQVGWKSIKEAQAKDISQAKQEDDHPMHESFADIRRPLINDRDAVMNEEPSPHSPPPTSEPVRTMEDHNLATAQQVTLAPPQSPHGFLDGIHYYASLAEQPPTNSTPKEAGIPTHDQTSPEPPEAVTPPVVAQEPTVTMLPPSTSPFDVPAIEYSGRNVVILEDIDADAQRLPELQNHVLLKKRKINAKEKQGE